MAKRRYQPVVVTYPGSGVVKDRQAFVLANDAFEEMQNIQTWRGRLRRRRGYELHGRLGRNLSQQALSNTGAGDYSDSDILTTLSLRANEPNAQIAQGNEQTITLTIDRSGTPTVYQDTTGTGVLTYVSGPGTGSGTINYNSGEISIAFTSHPGAGLTVDITFRYFPTLPVMGFGAREVPALNAEETIAYDTIYAYRYNNTAEQYREWITGTTWTGSDSDFFWSYNFWENSNGSLFWVSNNTDGGQVNATDPLRYSDGTAWTDFTPQTRAAGDILVNARIVIPYKGRLVVLNTVEAVSSTGSTPTTTHPQRARWAAIGSPIATDAWRDDKAGFGNYLDAPTSEAITGAAFIRDTLIVDFERSTWKLRYTGNQILPFEWERINVELGNSSTFSNIQFDRATVKVGDKAISECDGNYVQRIDTEIPDEVFRINNSNEGRKRVHGVRDFFEETVYWTYPRSTTDAYYPDQLLVWNYRDQTWNFYDDSFTAFGTWSRFDDRTWADLPDDLTWAEADFPWNDPDIQSGFPETIAGTQHGFVEIFNKQTSNAPTLTVTGITTGNQTQLTIPMHGLQDGDYVRITGMIGAGTELNGNIYQVTRESANVVTLLEYQATSGTFEYMITASGTYAGGGLVARRMNFVLKSKKFSAIEGGQQIEMGYIDFLFSTTAAGEVSCPIFIDYDPTPVNEDLDDSFFQYAVPTTAASDDRTENDKDWQRMFCPVSGQFIQFALTLSPSQMVDEDISNSDVLVDSFIVWLTPGGGLIE